MRKASIVLALTLVLLLSGCAQESASTEIDVASAAQAAVEALTFDDEMTLVTQDLALDFYGVDAADVKAVSAYMSTGATSEELSLWEAVNAEAAQRIHQALLSRVERQKELYASYAPEEAKRLDGFCVEERGNYLLLVVAGETASSADAAVKAVFP